jgi:hypothetical protein
VRPGRRRRSVMRVARATRRIMALVRIVPELAVNGGHFGVPGVPDRTKTTGFRIRASRSGDQRAPARFPSLARKGRSPMRALGGRRR